MTEGHRVRIGPFMMSICDCGKPYRKMNQFQTRCPECSEGAYVIHSLSR